MYLVFSLSQSLPADHLAFCPHGLSILFFGFSPISTSWISHISLTSSFLFRPNSVCPVIDLRVRISVVVKSRLVVAFSALVSISYHYRSYASCVYSDLTPSTHMSILPD